MLKKSILISIFLLFAAFLGHVVLKYQQQTTQMIECYHLEYTHGDYRTCYQEVLPKFKKKYRDYYLKLDYWIMATAISDQDMEANYQRLLNDEKVPVDLLRDPKERRFLLEQISIQSGIK